MLTVFPNIINAFIKYLLSIPFPYFLPVAILLSSEFVYFRHSVWWNHTGSVMLSMPSSFHVFRVSLLFNICFFLFIKFIIYIIIHIFIIYIYIYHILCISSSFCGDMYSPQYYRCRENPSEIQVETQLRVCPFYSLPEPFLSVLTKRCRVVKLYGTLPFHPLQPAFYDSSGAAGLLF